MKLEKRIIAFVKLGEALRDFFDDSSSNSSLKEVIKKAHQHNGWFTEENVINMIGEIGKSLEEEKIRKWISKYNIPPAPLPRGNEKRIGVIMAGNIPLVGFHDFLCVLMSGNIFVGKLSSDDEFLLPAVAEILIGIEPEFAEKIIFAPINSPFREGASSFIATGSNNSARYFEYYFGKYPHIIRKNRNAIAILDGSTSLTTGSTETEEDLKNLGKDIFQYFGLGCRNVSKIFIQKDYVLDKLFEAIVDFGDVIHHNKYANNYNYYRTIYLLNSEKFLDNNFLMMKEDKRIASPVATLYYERYNSKEELFEKLEAEKENIQCIVSTQTIPSPLERVRVRSGQTQSPELWDYADGVDTMEFLLQL